MKKYIGTKVVKAEPMTMKEAQKVLGRKIATLKPVTIEEDGYLVEYKDGYKSWSPKSVFDEAYHEVGLLTFGGAIILLKDGFAVRRKSWNGKGLFIVKQVPSHIGGDIIPKMQSLPQSAKDILMSRENPHIDYTNQMLIINTDGKADSWVPSSSDVFAKDWEVVKELEDNMEQNNKQTMPCFELGNLYVFNEEDEDGELTIIGKLIAKNESQDTLTFGNQYEIETENFVTDQAFDLRISTNKELREATDEEAILFQNAFTLWKKSKEHPSFKTFDKVLVRNQDEHKWRPAIFVQTRIGDSPYRYNALLLSTGHVGDFVQCIKYEGNEKMAFTAATF